MILQCQWSHRQRAGLRFGTRITTLTMLLGMQAKRSQPKFKPDPYERVGGWHAIRRRTSFHSSRSHPEPVRTNPGGQTRKPRPQLSRQKPHLRSIDPALMSRRICWEDVDGANSQNGRFRNSKRKLFLKPGLRL